MAACASSTSRTRAADAPDYAASSRTPCATARATRPSRLSRLTRLARPPPSSARRVASPRQAAHGRLRSIYLPYARRRRSRLRSLIPHALRDRTLDETFPTGPTLPTSVTPLLRAKRPLVWLSRNPARVAVQLPRDELYSDVCWSEGLDARRTEKRNPSPRVAPTLR